MKTQIKRIEERLTKTGTIENFDAINSRLTLRLGMHIHLLRSRGWDIQGKYKRDGRTGKLTKNYVYTLKSKPKV